MFVGGKHFPLFERYQNFLVKKQKSRLFESFFFLKLIDLPGTPRYLRRKCTRRGAISRGIDKLKNMVGAGKQQVIGPKNAAVRGSNIHGDPPFPTSLNVFATVCDAGTRIMVTTKECRVQRRLLPTSASTYTSPSRLPKRGRIPAMQGFFLFFLVVRVLQPPVIEMNA